MRRNSAIATTAALAGVLVAGTVAAVAIVNATDADPVASQVALLADVSPEPSTPALPSIGAGELPSVELPSSAPSTAPAPGEALATVGSQPEPVQAAAALTAAVARSAVLDQAAGTVLGVRSTVRKGYDAFAVKVERKDGSVVTGYVDKASGVVFDWREVSGPTPAPQASGEDESDDDVAKAKTETESEDHESDDHESEGTEVEHESDGDDD